MPVYEYRCSACGKRSTALLASYSSADPSCPHCGKLELKRLVSTFATVRSDDAGDFGGEDGGDQDYGGGGGDDDFGGGGDFGGDDDF